MPGRILIIDTVATNRIVLKVKMLAAHFTVDACSNTQEARRMIAAAMPDLILVNLTDPAENRHDFCKQLRNTPETASIAIIGVGVADTAMARFAALDAGADDVLPHPMNDTLLLARIRSLLRVHSTGAELFLRESTSRALGFDEQKAAFAAAASIGLLTDTAHDGGPVLDRLTQGLPQKIRVLDVSTVLKEVNIKPVPDLFVVDALNTGHTAPGGLFTLIADLRSRAETRHAAQLIVVPGDQPELAAMFLDLGADDVVTENCESDELALRSRTLIKRKQHDAGLRAKVRSGLQAAVTDPLTGLYNRRYADPHLAQLAAQSATSAQPFAVMMLDIDHFKQVNDTYGHAAGDQVLRQLSDCLRMNLRGADLIARIGGEEFLIAMPRTTEKEARYAADRLRRLVDETPFAVGVDGVEIAITISVGVAVRDAGAADAPDIQSICAHADRALFKAKSAGRNQVATSRSAA